jgi:hypothetical protein
MIMAKQKKRKLRQTKLRFAQPAAHPSREDPYERDRARRKLRLMSIQLKFNPDDNSEVNPSDAPDPERIS